MLTPTSTRNAANPAAIIAGGNPDTAAQTPATTANDAGQAAHASDGTTGQLPLQNSIADPGKSRPGNGIGAGTTTAQPPRSVVDIIDLSIEATERLESSTIDLAKLSVRTPTGGANNNFDVLGIFKPVLSEATARMSSDAYIVLSMLGIPPEKARKMAEAMGAAAPGDLKIGQSAGPNGLGNALSAREFVRGIANGQTGMAQAASINVIGQSIRFDSESITALYKDTKGSSKITINEFAARIEQIRIQIEQQYQQDPLVLDLDGNGIDTADLANGHRFDISGDGTIDQTAWVAGNDALLALDRNGDGVINDGRELFGDQNGAADGFGELAKFDDNGDGRIDGTDRVFSSLLLVHADGHTSSLADEGITSIELGLITPVDQKLAGGALTAISSFGRRDGSTGQIGDVLFDVRA